MVTVTEKAAKRLRELMAGTDTDGSKYNPETVGLKVSVQGGGCSGFLYGIQLENEPQANDLKSESNGIRVYIDPISASYLQGTEVDFDDFGGGFTINNPNVKSTCGCGQSFHV